MIKWCSWNVRGLNDPVKRRAMGDFLRLASVEVCCLLETRVRNANFSSLLARFGAKWRCVSNFDRGEGI